MSMASQVVVFLLDDRRYALNLSAVKKVIRVVEISPLPKAPDIVLGIVNLEGSIIPVVDVRRRFNLPGREIELKDQMIVVQTKRRKVALVVDAVDDVMECREETIVPAGDILPDIEYVRGVVKTEDGMILIHDLDTFLSLDEEEALTEALVESDAGGAVGRGT
jgi:purine-binding chemotaxis protein CheW